MLPPRVQADVQRILDEPDSAKLLGVRRSGLGVAAYKRLLQHDPCTYCGASCLPGHEREIDHIHARSKGGPDRWWNYTASCWFCNHCKLDDSPLGWLLRLHDEFLPMVAAREAAA